MIMLSSFQSTGRVIEKPGVLQGNNGSPASDITTCLGHWTTLNHRISLYCSYQALWATAQDTCGRIQRITAEHIKNGICPKMSAERLTQMVQVLSSDKIITVLRFNRSKELELFIFIRLEGAGVSDEKFIEVAEKLVIEARAKATAYKQVPDENDFQSAVNTYSEALEKYDKALKIKSKNGENIEKLEKTIKGLKKEFFIFNSSKSLKEYLPKPQDQKPFKEYLELFEGEEDCFSCLLTAASVYDIDKRSSADHFTCAYVSEALEDLMTAIQSYYELAKLQEKNGQISAALACLKRAESLVRKTRDPFAWAHFLEKLKRDWLIHLQSSVVDKGLELLLYHKNAVRICFEDCLKRLVSLSPQTRVPTCFICFNVEERDVVEWLEKVLVPDLDIIGIKPLSCFRDLRPGTGLNEFQGLIRRADQALIICTPALKKKCDERKKAPTGVAQEIRLAIERFNDADKYATIFPVYLKGNREDACPTDFFEGLFGTRFTILDKSTESSVFSYYSNAFELFGSMRGISRESSRQMKDTFREKMDQILKETIDNTAVE